ncbi:tRNA (adenosine(37)-N6)-dimethylallyltransferase MiaA [uncultured Mailhella sp.]|uniref:tRNA (adenosine(37)-N6)-dimethylallyltransferase MiaA n=1 Tax=uncultured Mailhella sp. TaxID=1981031 RepID=UPI002607C0EB|nr:tRNA (adenosine(37)-N6)-dimethylallyltransferase MiaA [uncultured Mailhella sp.]
MSLDLLCLAGPTGCGKTAAALHLAAALEKRGRPVTIINADSRQVYRDFPVITAQPAPEERSVCPHLLYGWLETTKKISAGEWAEKARQAIEESAAAGRLPMLVGGTGFYLRALLDGIADIPAPDPDIRQRIQEECLALGSPALHRRLLEVDPAYAARIHPRDSQRNMRALEVWESTGRTFTWWHERTPSPAPWRVLRLGIGLPLPELEPSLKQRIAVMMETGAVEEARQALKICPDTSAPAWTGIGCAEIAAFLLGRLSREECLERWAHNTRAYAKRQWTWFRADKRILWHRPKSDAVLFERAAAFLGL